jgi:hypothetical protein
MTSTFDSFQSGGGRSGGSGSDYGDGEDDRRRLQIFVKTLGVSLVNFIEDPEWLTSDMQQSAFAAWDAGPADEVQRLLTMLETPSWTGDLADHGLLGHQLDFKLRVFERAEDLRLSAAAQVADGTAPRRAADAAGEEYLKCADIILESLSSALGGAGAALIEFKKMIEWLKGIAARFGVRF